MQPDDFVPFCIIRVIYERLSRLSTLPAHSGGRAGAPLPIRRSPGPHVSLSHPRPGVPAASGGRAGPESREPSAGRERAAGEVRGCLGSCHNIGFLVLFFFVFLFFVFFFLLLFWVFVVVLFAGRWGRAASAPPQRTLHKRFGKGGGRRAAPQTPPGRRPRSAAGCRAEPKNVPPLLEGNDPKRHRDPQPSRRHPPIIAL